MNGNSLIKDKFIDYIDNLINNNKVSHAYLIEVDDFDADFKYISLFIKMILSNCTHDKVLKSNEKYYKMIDNKEYPDLKIIEPDGINIKKSQLLDLQKEFNNTSLIGNKRFYIITDADKLNPSSANTMLKFLEEPGDNIFALLVTCNRYLVIDTILSRCQILSLKDNNYNTNFDSNSLDFLDVILKPRNYFLQNKYILDKIIIDKNSLLENLNNIEHIIISYFDSIYIENNNINIDEQAFLIMNNCSRNTLLYIISTIEELIPKLNYNVNYKLWLDAFFAKLIIGGLSND